MLVCPLGGYVLSKDEDPSMGSAKSGGRDYNSGSGIHLAVPPRMQSFLGANAVLQIEDVIPIRSLLGGAAEFALIFGQTATGC